MKVRKNAQQKNTEINDSMYSRSEIQEMLDAGIIFWLDSECNIRYEYKYDNKNPYRIFLSDLKEIKVIYHNEYGCYMNVGIDGDGNVYYINL